MEKALQTPLVHSSHTSSVTAMGRCHSPQLARGDPASGYKGARLTGLVDGAEAGEGGVQAGALLAVGSKLLHGRTDLVIGHVQQLLQAQLPRGDFLTGRNRAGVRKEE